MRIFTLSIRFEAVGLAVALMLAAALGGVSACTAAPAEPVPSPSAAVERAGERLAMADMVVDGVPLFAGRDVFIERFGEPLSRDIQEKRRHRRDPGNCVYDFGEAVFSREKTDGGGLASPLMIPASSARRHPRRQYAGGAVRRSPASHHLAARNASFSTGITRKAPIPSRCRRRA